MFRSPNFLGGLVGGGPRNPYPHDLGVFGEGASADLLVVDGTPLEDLTRVTDCDHIHVIMKVGVVDRNAF